MIEIRWLALSLASNNYSCLFLLSFFRFCTITTIMVLFSLIDKLLFLGTQGVSSPASLDRPQFSGLSHPFFYQHVFAYTLRARPGAWSYFIN